MRGRYKFKLPKAGNATYFFLTRGSGVHGQTKLQLYSTTASEAQTPTYVEVLP